MVKSNADKQREYRNRKRNAPVTESNAPDVTRVTVTDSVTPSVTGKREGSSTIGMVNDLHQSIRTAVVIDKHTCPGPTEIGRDAMIQRMADKVVEIATPTHLIKARARRTNPDSLNWGPHMTSDQLHEAGLKANRVPIPGDWDYVGVAV